MQVGEIQFGQLPNILDFGAGLFKFEIGLSIQILGLDEGGLLFLVMCQKDDITREVLILLDSDYVSHS